MEVMLDCALLREKGSAHVYLQQAFSFPEWYGKNLDALYDCLTELPPCRVELKNPAALYEEGSYGAKILQTLQDAARENPGLELFAGNEVEE